MRPLLLIFLSVILLAGCADNSADEIASLTSELEKSKEEISKLSTENAKLKSELSDIKNGPGKLLAKANRHYEEKDLDGLNAALASLQNNLHVYIGVKDGTAWLRIRIQYTGDDWVFIDNYRINVDGTNVDIATSYDNVVRDNDYGRVWEYYDGPVSALEYDLLLSIADSKKTIVRHQGREHRYDRTVTAKEKQAIKNVLDAYEALGGTPPLY